MPRFHRTGGMCWNASSFSSTPQPGLFGISRYPSFFTISGSFNAPANVNRFQIEFDCTTGAAAGSAEAVRIDNVSLTQVVPEPASLSLAGLSLLGVWTLRRSWKV